jgi:ATP-binding cassette subfamily D (ALD) protein 3
MIYYQICNLDSRISCPDQRLTQDIQKWGESFSNLYSNFSKPLLDIVLFSKKLAELVGWEGPAMIIVWYLMSGMVIKSISPPFGKLVAMEQKFEGDYRQTHNELLNHAEEVAFYSGNLWEKKRINESFKVLYNHIDHVLIKKMFMGIFDSMLVKYGATMVGYTILGLPVFGRNAAKYHVEERASH